jgi:hypothetical protein
MIRKTRYLPSNVLQGRDQRRRICLSVCKYLLTTINMIWVEGQGCGMPRTRLWNGTATLWNVQGGATFVLDPGGATALVHASIPPEKGKGTGVKETGRHLAIPTGIMEWTVRRNEIMTREATYCEFYQESWVKDGSRRMAIG